MGEDERGSVKKSYTSSGARSLRGTMKHRSVKTAMGKGVVPDKNTD